MKMNDEAKNCLKGTKYMMFNPPFYRILTIISIKVKMYVLILLVFNLFEIYQIYSNNKMLCAQSFLC